MNMFEFLKGGDDYKGLFCPFEPKGHQFYLHGFNSSIIDALPNFEVSQQSQPGQSGLSQASKNDNFSKLSNQDASSLLKKADSQSSRVGDVMPDSSVSTPLPFEKVDEFSCKISEQFRMSFISSWTLVRPNPGIVKLLIRFTLTLRKKSLGIEVVGCGRETVVGSHLSFVSNQK